MPLTVIGVAPPAFQGAVIGPSDDVWIPNMIARVAFRQMDILSRGSKGDQSPLRLVGRLKPGLTIDIATTDLMVLAGQLHAAFPDQHPSPEVAVYPLNGIDPHRRSEHSRLIVVLGTTATMVLVIACANLPLRPLRGLQRSKEIATRFALGAGRGQVIRQFLTESIVLVLVGGLAGLLVASWFAALLENHYPVPLDVHIDRQTAAFNTLLAVVAGFAFGARCPPCGTSPRRPVRIQQAMASASITRSLRRRPSSCFRSGLSVVLVAGAALLIQSRAGLYGNPGIRCVESSFTPCRLKPHLSGDHAVKERAYFAEVQRRLASLAGVQSIAFVSRPPLRGQELPEVCLSVSLSGDESATPERALGVKENIVSASFFETLAVPILRGRGFETRELETARAVVVVNDASHGAPGQIARPPDRCCSSPESPTTSLASSGTTTPRSGEAPAPFLFRAGQAGNLDARSRRSRSGGDASTPAARDKSDRPWCGDYHRDAFRQRAAGFVRSRHIDSDRVRQAQAQLRLR